MLLRVHYSQNHLAVLLKTRYFSSLSMGASISISIKFLEGTNREAQWTTLGGTRISSTVFQTRIASVYTYQMLEAIGCYTQSWPHGRREIVDQ